MGTDPVDYVEAKQASERVQSAAQEATDRWKWVRLLAYLIGFLTLCSAFFGGVGLLTTRDTRDAVQTAEFSEQQRAARSNRADCIREYETDYRLADAKFNAAIVNYLAFAQGSVMDAAALLDDLNRVGANLAAIQNNELCSKEEFGVRD